MELYDRDQTRFISAHTSAIAQLALSLDGRVLATASKQGTLIRLWNTADGNQLQVCITSSALCGISVCVCLKRGLFPDFCGDIRGGLCTGTSKRD